MPVEPKTPVQVLVRNEANTLLHNWLRDRDLSEIDELTERIAVRARDMHIWNTLATFPIALICLIGTLIVEVLVLRFVPYVFVKIAGVLLGFALIARYTRLYFRIGAVTKTHGFWQRGRILIKPNLPDSRRTVLAMHEVVHSAIALGVIPPPKNPQLGEEALAVAVETLRMAELEGRRDILGDPIAGFGAELHKSISSGRIPPEQMLTILEAAAKYSPAFRSLESGKILIARLEAFNAGLTCATELRAGKKPIAEFVKEFSASGTVQKFGLSVGWAKLHGLLFPEFEAQLTTILTGGDPTEQDMHKFLHGMVGLQAGMWCGQLAASGKVDKQIVDFMLALIGLSLMTPLQAYDIARRAVEGEYDEANMMSSACRFGVTTTYENGIEFN